MDNREDGKTHEVEEEEAHARKRRPKNTPSSNHRRGSARDTIATHLARSPRKVIVISPFRSTRLPDYRPSTAAGPACCEFAHCAVYLHQSLCLEMKRRLGDTSSMELTCISSPFSRIIQILPLQPAYARLPRLPICVAQAPSPEPKSKLAAVKRRHPE